MAQLPLSIALGDYDHVRDVVSGTVPIEGINARFLTLSIEELTTRFMRHVEFDVCELSFGNYCASLNRPDPPAIAIPVFTSRAFRHGAVYVRGDSPLGALEQLAGKRLGIPQWSQTATIWVRGLLADHGVALDQVTWLQAGVVEPGRAETANFRLPSGVTVTSMPTRTLTEMLRTGEIDACITAKPPGNLGDEAWQTRPLLPDARQHERDYWDRTGVFPIMHLMVVKRSAYERDRWIARSLFDAFEKAKQRSLQRIEDPKTSYFPVGWGRDQALASRSLLFGTGNPWPYGLTGNRATIDAFLSYCHTQGLLDRLCAAEEIFAPETLGEVRV